MLLVLGDVGDVTNRPDGIAVPRDHTRNRTTANLFRVQQFDLKTFAQPRLPMRIGAALPAPASGSPALCGSIIL